MYDPTSQLAAPPPRYLLESDSSDEEGQGAYRETSHRPTRPSHRVAVRLISPPSDPLADSPAPATGRALEGAGVVGIGQAGKYLLRRALGRPVLEVTVDGKRAGTGVAVDGGVVVAVQDGASEDAFQIVTQLAGLVKADSWTLFSSYVPSMYIPLGDEILPADPPVRFLSSVQIAPTEHLRKYDAPNYVTNVAGAFLSLAAHPAAPVSNATLFLLPLPLSQLSPVAFKEALESLPPSPAKQLSRHAPWNEDDDERFAGPGMGARPSSAWEGPSDGAGMYM